jgi:hypothetical protein
VRGQFGASSNGNNLSPASRQIRGNKTPGWNHTIRGEETSFMGGQIPERMTAPRLGQVRGNDVVGRFKFKGASID